MLLGIKKKEIAHLVIIENILLGILAFVLAIPIGFFIQPVCVVSNCKLTGYSKNSLYFFEFCFYWTIDNLFLTIYVLVLLNLLRRISKMTIRDFFTLITK